MSTLLAYFKPITRANNANEDETTKKTDGEAPQTPQELRKQTKKRRRGASKSMTLTDSLATSESVASTNLNVATNENVMAIADTTPIATTSLSTLAITKASPESVHVADGISEYERKRQLRMAENAKFMQQLGLATTQKAMIHAVQSATVNVIKNKKSKKSIKPRELPRDPPRRSQRLRGNAAVTLTSSMPEEEVISSNTLVKGDQYEQDDERELLLQQSFDDSSVWRYICEASSTFKSSATNHEAHASSSQSRLVGFSLSASTRTMTDPKLKKIYSMSFSPFEENGLIATGGHQGFVSIYPLHTSVITTQSCADEQIDLPLMPLMSFKAHSGWISCVSLAKCAPQNHTNILLTASNDSFVKVWNLNQSSSILHTAKEVYSTNDLHYNGIFGLDLYEDSMLTCSKDASIVLSRFRDDTGSSLEVVQRYEKHEGVVKSVRFSPTVPQQFASGGNDRALRVFDVRVPESLTLEIRNAHARAINSVQFHPTEANLLLSASFDTDFHLFDLRNPSLPLFTFHGHPLDKQQSSIFHPIFVDNGNAIVATGDPRNQELSLYKTSDGSTVSRGDIGIRADYIAADPFQERILVSSGPSLSFYEYRRET